ncbi:inter-alpha-trypsin inhibitor heavy chain H4-like [Octopus sinensis]|uniref:Inter-alpha-trypsin inhibitor heavy chain H4-like n=1 Tax=Octopus sinensis TaxID=2607531 RepID=A0A6P7T3Q9_9MOLL|nr:inter-alpha-trypsin inhibitor heavy chain H4-like [Octopus sinensis]XP_036364929.1 inter-alpha-trypsin inhibitor heavy chain H4-like [Octopus sinensis]
MMKDIENNMFIFQLLLFGFVLGSEVVADDSSLNIHSFSVMSDIKFRYATTRVETVFKNTRKSSALAVFHVNIPENAFVSNFTMEVNGSVFVGDVLEKKQAKEIYDKAAQRGESAGYVGTEHRHTSTFHVMVSVEAQKTAVFTLTYQELLRRSFGKYKHVIHLTNKQIIENFKIEVFISELQGISRCNVELKQVSFEKNAVEIRKETKEVGNIDYKNNKQVYINYEPSVSDQKALSSQGITGLFEVNYDVDWKVSSNMVYAIDGYFVHFYAPDSFPSLQKKIVFMLDVSGSMSGRKLKQLKKAMTGILHSLKQALDTFMIGIFSSGIDWMTDGFLPASKENINVALNYIDRLSTGGGTNINEALLTSLNKFDNLKSSETKNLIFFLTDGQPTDGVVDWFTIIKNVAKANSDTSIFTLGFGENSDMNFLKQLAGANGGFSRKIYVAADSRMQILNLYQEISRILLKNIDIVYLDDAINRTTLTENSFSYYFKGSEIVVAGTTSEDLKEDISILLTMDTSSGLKSEKLKLPIENLNGEFQLGLESIPQNPKLTTLQSLHTITRNTWVHLTLKKLLNLERTPKVRDQIISIALKYGFVTPLTSMVVVQNMGMKMVRDGDRLIERSGKRMYLGISCGNTSFSYYLLLVIGCLQMYFQNW